MRRLGFVIVGLGAGACFDGGDATGFPCTEDAQCGAGIACLDGVCGGATPTSSTGTTLPGSSSGATSSTSSSPDSSSSGTTTGSTSTGSTTTGDVALCQPTPIPLCNLDAPRADRANFRTEIVTSSDGATLPIARPMSVVSGDFDDDARSDLALVDFQTWRLHIFFNRDGIGWTEFSEPPFAAGQQVEPYDVVATDLDCMGGTDFVVATQQAELVIRAFDNQAFPSAVPLPSRISGFSLAVGDLVADDAFYPDVVLGAGSLDDGAQLFVNTLGTLESGASIDTTVNEPWETAILDTIDGPVILVAEGRNGPGAGAGDSVRVLRVVDDVTGPQLVEPPLLELPHDFASPWAMAIGNFIGDANVELAVGERRVDGNEEQTSTNGTVRIFSFQGVNADSPWIESIPAQGLLTVGRGLNSMSAANLDCDGYDDIVVGRTGDSTVPDGDGSFPVVLYGAGIIDAVETVDVPLDAPMAAASRHAVADFDLDGALEVAIPDFGFEAPGARVVIVSLAE